MARSQRVRTSALVLANLLLPIAVLAFAAGFFPYKPVLPGLATFEEQDGVRHAGEERAAKPMFDKVVFMVVDALRSDFVYGYESGMEFTQSLIRTGAAIPFTAHATPPTVTMPRVKALTTGSVPSFLDLILNFAESDTSSSLAAQDTWLAQIRAQGGKVVFYGDDTWLKLFPPNSKGESFFAREDGTSSFFVSDFTEVDLNVTRHLPRELRRPDWNALIMHYLGLDHIGHKTGPQGPNMLPKQREMDGVVKDIYTAMENEAHLRDTLLVLCGDHGMNAGGNHGGSGPGETEPALVFVSPKIKDVDAVGRKEYACPTTPKEGTEFHYYTKVEQSDLVPTLAGLMGLPISRNSLGVLIPEMSGLLQEGDGVVEHLRRNAVQILKIVEATYGEENSKKRVEGFKHERHLTGEMCEDKPEGEARLACLWAYAEEKLDSRSTTKAKQAALMAFLLEAQETLSGTASSYNIPFMVGGMALTAVIAILSLLSFPMLYPPSTAGVSLALTSILYGVMMFASSYVEEEQQFWYWLTPAWIILLTVQTASKTSSLRTKYVLAVSATAILAVHRFCIRWNQTGQKHAGEPDIVHAIFPEAHVFMWLLILAAYACNGYFLVQRAFAGLLAPEISVLVAVSLELLAIVFKLNFTQADAPELVQGLAERIREWSSPFDLVLQARIVFAGLATVTIVVVTLSVLSARESRRMGMKEAGLLPSLAERLHVLLTLFLMTQMRAPNVPLFLGLEIQKEALSRILNVQAGERRVTATALTTLLLSHVYFFCTGGSNSISSIDLSNAYNGVADYNIVAVGVLLFASNWTGPIWWCSAASGLLNSKPRPLSLSKPKENGRSWIDDERSKLHDDTLKAMMGPEKTRGQQTEPGSDGGKWALYISCMTAFISAGLLAVMAACTALRTHLFIWTVFSPKYLYAMAWAVGWHLLFNIGFGSLMNWVAGVA